MLNWLPALSAEAYNLVAGDVLQSAEVRPATYLYRAGGQSILSLVMFGRDVQRVKDEHPLGHVLS